jgi:hypothetical protein
VNSFLNDMSILTEAESLCRMNVYITTHIFFLKFMINSWLKFSTMFKIHWPGDGQLKMYMIVHFIPKLSVSKHLTIAHRTYKLIMKHFAVALYLIMILFLQQYDHFVILYHFVDHICKTAVYEKLVVNKMFSLYRTSASHPRAWSSKRNHKDVSGDNTRRLICKSSEISFPRLQFSECLHSL